MFGSVIERKEHIIFVITTLLNILVSKTFKTVAVKNLSNEEFCSNLALKLLPLNFTIKFSNFIL